MADVIIIIIIVPCSPTTSTYVSGLSRCRVGESSSLRTARANRPPAKKYTSIADRYCRPTTLWSRLYRKYRLIRRSVSYFGSGRRPMILAIG